MQRTQHNFFLNNFWSMSCREKPLENKLVVYAGGGGGLISVSGAKQFEEVQRLLRRESPTRLRNPQFLAEAHSSLSYIYSSETPPPLISQSKSSPQPHYAARVNRGILVCTLEDLRTENWLAGKQVDLNQLLTHISSISTGWFVWSIYSASVRWICLLKTRKPFYWKVQRILLLRY
jgi:hypothetical protein